VAKKMSRGAHSKEKKPNGKPVLSKAPLPHEDHIAKGGNLGEGNLGENGEYEEEMPDLEDYYSANGLAGELPREDAIVSKSGNY